MPTKFSLERQVRLIKRLGHIYQLICSKGNLKIAYQKAKQGKGYYKEIKELEKDLDNKLEELRQMLLANEYRTSQYIKFILTDGPKERTIYKLPFYPDRIVHWAIMLQIEPILINTFIYDTYSAIPGRGMHLGLERVRQAMKKDPAGTQYCFKFDIKHYYQSINHDIMLNIFKKKIKDRELLDLLYEIISSINTAEEEDLKYLYGDDWKKAPATGVPIGNYLSQYCGNLYLTQLDKYVKDVLGIKYYFRYMDDIVILAESKDILWDLKEKIVNFIWDNLRLKLKQNYQVFPVEARGVDFLGYRIFHNYVLLRQSTKKTIRHSSARA